MLNRRTLLGTAAAAPLLTAPAFAQNRARVLRYVPSSNLTVLDPIFTPASVSITHGYCVFDTLYGVDAEMRPQPQMAAGHTVSDDGLTWEITLRDGLKFHDGEPVRARDRAAAACVGHGALDPARAHAFGQCAARGYPGRARRVGADVLERSARVN